MMWPDSYSKQTIRFFFYLCTILWSASGQVVLAQRITVTLVGKSIAGSNGDGKAGQQTLMSYPSDVITDVAGNIYFTDHFRIRRLSAATGLVTTFAGGGTSTADGIPATSASVSAEYLCMPADGKLCFGSGTRVRCVNTTTGIITTIAGSTTSGFSGDGGPASAALLANARGICADISGNIFVTDNNRIREISAATGLISTVAGGGSLTVADGLPATGVSITPYVVAVNSFGELFFVDGSSQNYIRKVDLASGTISLYAGNGDVVASGDGGPATAAGLGQLYGLCCDDSGNVHGNDISCSCRKIDRTTGLINVVAGSLYGDGYNGDGINSLNADFNYPYGLHFDAEGNLFVADNQNYRVRKSIKLTHNPVFAIGRVQHIDPCPGRPGVLNSVLAIADLDSAQTENWTVLTVPVNGTLSGFPFSMPSHGTDSLSTPVGLFYTSTAGYAGPDSFRVMISDGLLSDTVLVYVNVANVSPGTIVGVDSVCPSMAVHMTDTIVLDGEWAMADAVATVSPVGTVTGLISGVDTVLFMVSTGTCTDTARMPITVLNPGAGSITGLDSVCPGATVALLDTVPTYAGYWSCINTNATISTAGVLTGVTPGPDTVWYMMSDYCGTYYASLPVVVREDSLCTTVPTRVSSMTPLSLQLFPNPTTSLLSVACGSVCNRVVVRNRMGQVMVEKNMNATDFTIDVSDWPAGIYLLKADDSPTNIFVKE